MPCTEAKLGKRWCVTTKMVCNQAIFEVCLWVRLSGIPAVWANTAQAEHVINDSLQFCEQIGICHVTEQKTVDKRVKHTNKTVEVILSVLLKPDLPQHIS